MQEMAHIPKGQDLGNCVSLLRASICSFSFSLKSFLENNSSHETLTLTVNVFDFRP